MVDTGATPRKSWRRSTWALAIGTGLALLVFCLTWLRQGDMPGPLVAVAVGWIVLAPPIYDHSWPAIAFLIWTALVVLWLGPNHGDYVVATGIVMLWFLGGAILAIIRLFIFGRDSAAAWRAQGRCFNCGAVIEPHDGPGPPPTRCDACRS